MRASRSLRIALSVRLPSGNSTRVLARRAPSTAFAVARPLAIEGFGLPEPRPVWCRAPRRGFATQQAAEGQEKTSEEAKASSAEADAGGSEAKKADAEQQAASEEKNGSSATASAGAGEAPEETPKESPEELLQKELQEVQEKIKAEKHSLLLALADFENNKKRYMRERESRRRTAMVNFAERLVEVYDKFDVLAHSSDKVQNLSEACQALQEGISMTHNIYRTTLEKFDVVLLEPEIGSPLIAARHENVGSVEDGSLPSDAIAELVKPGWVFEPKSSKPAILRRAQVKVARQGPATPPAPP